MAHQQLTRPRDVAGASLYRVRDRPYFAVTYRHGENDDACVASACQTRMRHLPARGSLKRSGYRE